MIRTALFTTLLLCLFSCSSKKKEETSLEEMNLKGAVKSYKVMVFYIEDKWEKPGKRRIGEGNDTNIYVFNTNGMLVERDEYNTDKNHHFTTKTYTIYDSSGKRIKDSLWNEPPYQFIGCYRYLYDPSGNLSEKQFVDPKGQTQSDRYTYYSNGNRLSSATYYQDKCYFVSFYLNNDHGDPIRETTFFQEFPGKNRAHYTYNQQHKLVKRIGYKPDKSLNYKETYSYNSQGDVVTIRYFKTDGTEDFTEHFSYRYDAHENWIRKTRTCRNYTLDITERTITYY